MKVKESNYIKNNKALFKTLSEKLNEKYEYASVFVQDSYGKTYSASRAGLNVREQELSAVRGFVVKVLYNGAFFEYSGNDISESLIPEILKEIDEKLVVLLKDNAFNRYEAPKDEPLTFDKSTDVEVDPEEIGDAAILKRISEVYEEGMKRDERVLNCMVSTSYKRTTNLFLSKNRDLTQNLMWSQSYVVIGAKRGEEVKSYFQSNSVLGGMELLSELDEHLDNAVKGAIDLLDSEQIEPGEYECICTPETTVMIVHEAFGHGVEMDMFVKDRALAKSVVGEYVASPLVTMHDGNAIDQTATYFFDDEGTLSEDTVIIDKGVLVRGMCDMQSAMALNAAATGNGRRESYKRKAYTRMTNTYFEAGTDKLEDMIASIKYGFLLENPSSGMEDPKNWGIQMMVNVAREIKDGKLTGKVFSPIVMTGYVPTLLKSISMVSDKAYYNGSGFCGKGYKEYVKVSDGGPYIKAKIRLG